MTGTIRLEFQLARRGYGRYAAYPGATKLGRGIGYDYPHDHPGHVNAQRHLPDGLEALRFYTPADTEPELRERWERARQARERDR